MKVASARFRAKRIGAPLQVYVRLGIDLYFDYVLFLRIHVTS